MSVDDYILIYFSNFTWSNKLTIYNKSEIKYF